MEEPKMQIQKVTDPAFRKYGKVLEGYEIQTLLREMEHTPLPDEVIYVASDENLEALAVAEKFQNYGYGGQPIQIGYCNGNNTKLNALEYHRDSEINVAVTDLILLLGKEEDIADTYTYDTSLVEAFLVPAGTVIEVYGTTLHYAPCNAGGKGFRCVVILPRGTNTELTFDVPKDGEASLLTARNKWLLAHPESGIEGTKGTLTGENITL